MIGQYHWVSEFAPPQYQRVLSYASGWMSTLGWLASVASSVFVLGVEVQALIEAILPDYSFTNWQLSLIMIAFLLVTIVFNTYGARVLPALEVASLIGHSLGFFVVMIPLLVLCPKNSAYDVFVNFQDNSGYNNIGIAYLTSQITVIYCNLGSDSVCAGSLCRRTNQVLILKVTGRSHLRGSRRCFAHRTSMYVVVIRRSEILSGSLRVIFERHEL